MAKQKKRLESEAVGLELDDSQEMEFTGLLNEAQDKISGIKKDAAETAESLSAMRARIEEHKIIMQKLKNLGPDLF